ncbi:unnamed protein product, partial [Linum tenue]
HRRYSQFPPLRIGIAAEPELPNPKPTQQAGGDHLLSGTQHLVVASSLGSAPSQSLPPPLSSATRRDPAAASISSANISSPLASILTQLDPAATRIS